MKLVRDLSLTSAIANAETAIGNWDSAWASPISATPPAAVLDFSAGVFGLGGTLGTLASTMALTRNSQATRIDSVGAIEVVGADVARLDHDPSTLAPTGLLLEATRTNLLVNSGAPAGQGVDVLAVPHVLSFYGSGTVTLTGAHSATLNGSAGYPARTDIAFTPTAGTLVLAFAGEMIAPQLEAGNSASSYMPTAATAAVRQDDVAIVTLGAWFSAVEGTLVFSGSLEYAQANDRIIELDAGATSTRLSLLWNSVLGKPQFQVWNGGALQAAIAPPGNSIALGDHFRVSIAFSANDFAVSLNGSALAKDASGSMPAGLTALRFGRSLFGSQSMLSAEGLTYYSTRLADAEVQALSA